MPSGLPIFIVEGYLEHDFLSKTCGRKIRVLRLSNGKHVSAAALAKQVFAQLCAVSDQPPFVVVLADKESRPSSALELEKEVKKELRNLGVKIPVFVHVPDMMIENWILADPAVIAGEGLTVELPNGSEGCHGKNKLSGAFRRRRLAHKERIDGVRMLRACSANTIKQHSPSFARMHKALSSISLECYWLSK